MRVNDPLSAADVFEAHRLSHPEADLPTDCLLASRHAKETVREHRWFRFPGEIRSCSHRSIPDGTGDSLPRQNVLG
jgi:hypothetical protein